MDDEEIRIHLACDGWEGVALSQRSGTFSITRMLPPGVAAYFYSRRSPAKVEEWHAERARREDVRKRWKERMLEEGGEAAAAAADGGTNEEGEPIDPEEARQAVVKRLEQEAKEEEAEWEPLPDAAPITYFTVPAAPSRWELRVDTTAKELEEMLPGLRFLHPKQGSPSRNPYRHYLRLPPSVRGLATVNVALVQPSLCVRPHQAVPRADEDAVLGSRPAPAWSWRNSVFAQRAEAVGWSLRGRARLRQTKNGRETLATESVDLVLRAIEALVGTGDASASPKRGQGDTKLFTGLSLPALRAALTEGARMDAFSRVFNYVAARSMAEAAAPGVRAPPSGASLKVLREILEASDQNEWGPATTAHVESAARACRHRLVPLFDGSQPSSHGETSPRGSALIRYRVQTLVVGLAMAQAAWEAATLQRKEREMAKQAAREAASAADGAVEGEAESGAAGATSAAPSDATREPTNSQEADDDGGFAAVATRDAVPSRRSDPLHLPLLGSRQRKKSPHPCCRSRSLRQSCCVTKLWRRSPAEESPASSISGESFASTALVRGGDR